MDAYIMVYFSWEELKEEAQYIPNILARGARTLSCSIWNKYPDQFTKTDNALLSPIKFFWNKVCQDEDVNKQPEPPFTGGQCVGVTYKVVGTITENKTDPRTGADLGNTLWQFDNVLSGSGAYTKRIFPEIGFERGGNSTLAIGFDTSYGGSGTATTSVYTGTSPLAGNGKITSVSVNLVRADGLPDTCGDPPAVFPTTQPPLPGQEVYPVPINDGNDIDLTVPLGWFDIDFSVPLTFNFSVGDIIIDVGGVVVNFNNNNNWRIEESPIPVDLPPYVVNDIDDIKEDVKEVKDIQEEEKKKFNKTEYDVITYNTCEGIEVTNSNITAVEIIVTQIPTKNKVIVNNTESNTFFWAGYFCWTAQGARLPQDPVQKKDNIFLKPDRTTGFSFFCVNNSCVKVNVYTKRIVPV